MNFGRTIEDRIAEQDEDYKRAQNSAVAWAHEQMNDPVPADVPERKAMHRRREKSVVDAEAERIKQGE